MFKLSCGWIFENSHFEGTKYTIKTSSFAGKVKCGGPEGKTVVAHSCRKRKKLIYGTEWEIMVAHGRLSSPARSTLQH